MALASIQSSIVLRTAALATTLFCVGCGPMESNPGGSADGATRDAALGEAQCGPCPLWTVRCGDRCVDPTVSPNNCGTCGVQCDTAREVCQGGVCVAAQRCTALDAGVLGIGATDAGTRSDASPTRDVSAARDVATTSGGDGGADAGLMTSGGAVGLRGEYYAHSDFTGLRFVRVDRTIEFDWSMAAPVDMFPRENFSVRWSGELRPSTSGRYAIHVAADDAVRVWLDGERVVDEFDSPAPVTADIERMLDAHRAYAIRIDYRQRTGPASVRVTWSRNGGEPVPLGGESLSARRGDAWACAGGECCPVGPSTLCCPTGTRCVIHPTFRGCCPEGETCIAVAACPADR